MAEMFLLANASPRQLEEFENWVNTRRYPFEGRYRKGINRPFITEHKLYSVKMKKEAVPMFLSELKGSTQELTTHGAGNVVAVANHIQRVINFGIRVFNLAYTVRHRFKRKKPGEWRHPLKNELFKDKIEIVDMRKVEKGPDSLQGWVNTKVLFNTNDMVNVHGEEEL